MASPHSSPAVGLAGRTLIVAAALAVGLTILLGWWIARMDVPEPVPAHWPEWFPAGQVDADAGYRRGLWILAGLSLPVGPLVALAFVRWGRRWRPRALAITGGRIWLAGAAGGALLALALAVAGVPLGLAGLIWRREHDVSRQSFADWTGDVAAAAMIQALILGVAGLVLAMAIARLPRGWWVVLAGLAAITIAATSVLSPLVIEPLFERTQPLADRALAADARALADEAGVAVGDVVVSDASVRTRTINARVSGLGASRRIVLYDTLVDGVPRAEARFVIAHELAHVRGRHVLVGGGWAVAFTVPVALAIFGIVGWRAGVGRAPPGPAGGDLVLRRLALALALIVVALVLAAPLGNAVSRALEAEADWTALRLTDDPAAAIALQRDLVRLRRGDPDPPGVARFWFGTHPSPIERVGLALRYRREE